MTIKTKTLWAILLITVPVSAINIGGNLFELNFFQGRFFYSFLFFAPVILLLLHSIWTLSFFRGLLFILIACLTGFIFEFIGLKYGTVFGGDYVYSLGGTEIFTVPLIVVLYWGVFIYVGYCITNSFLYWLNKDKPSKNKKAGFMLPLLVLFDSLIVVAIDLFMDPLQVKMGDWIWPDGGPYFGIPIGNFVGWALVTIITTGLFRIYEYFRPMVIDKKLKSVFLIPVLGYGMLYLNYLSLAVKLNMISLAFIGSLTMLPIVVTNLFLFKQFARGKKSILA